MTTPLIEAIARAIHDTLENDDDSCGGGYMRSAHAALIAITEAGYAVVPVEPETETLLTMAQHADFAGWPAAYRAMIDESSMITAAQGDGE